MIRRLKIKFVCINMLIVTVMLSVIFGMVLHITHRNMEEQADHLIQSIHEDPQRRGPGLRDRRIPFFTVSVSPQGVMNISSNTYFDRTIDQELLQIARNVYEGTERQGVLKEHDLRFLRRSTPSGEQIVFLDISMEQGMMEQLVKTCISISIVSFLLFLVISILLAQWAVRPMETAWKNQRQFVADASHELKTPLTVIMTNAELLQEKSYGESSREQFICSIQSMSRQMRGLVEGLLDLSRVDNGVAKTTFAEISLSELVSDSLLPFEPLFFEKGMVLEADVEQGIVLRGSESHLRQVTEILLDNAVKYGQTEKPVQVQLSRQGRYALLRVETHGNEISKEDLKNIFRRFYRIDQARSMNQSYGLGLSIAEGIVKEHGGKIWAESKNAANSFFVQLPITAYSGISRRIKICKTNI